MRFLTIFFLSIFIHICFSWEDKDDLIVQLNDGEILGRYMTSESGRTISAFLGIPFARPPVSDLRFKAPQKVEPWNNTLLTQNQRSKCPQIDSLSASPVYEGDEDCLYLNVYVPEKRTGDILNVLVWFHGGGFTFSHGGPSSYSPDYILDHDVIFVAGNYRLGPLGFLSTEDINCPGNFGLKDQVLLLKWVQENIEHFGGDKSSVTIWGESAGGVSVNFHMLSPMSRGLFHRAISNSGRIAEPARSGVGKGQAERLAVLMNCSSGDSEEIIRCLRNLSPEAIITASAGSFPIVVESFESDEETFIAERNIDDLFLNSVEIPWLVGINSEEGILSVAQMLSNDLSMNNLIATWNTFLPNTFDYSHLDQVAQDAITSRINGFYFGNETTPTNQLDRNNLIHLFTDRYLAILETVRHRLGHSNHQNTYIYLYTHKGTSSFSPALDFYGTCHIDELIPLFPFRKTSLYSAIPTDQDKELTKVMSLMWTNFVRTGNPTPDNSATPIWPLATTFPLNYMQIGNENGKFDSQILQPRVDFSSARVNFWIELRDDYRISSWFEGNSSTSCHSSLALVGFLLLGWYFINF